MKEGFLRNFMSLGHGIPSRDAFSDLFSALDPGGLRGVLTRTLSGWGGRLDDMIAILRPSFQDAADRSPLHLVHAFAAESRLLPVQVRVDGRWKGITAVPALLDKADGEPPEQRLPVQSVTSADPAAIHVKVPVEI